MRFKTTFLSGRVNSNICKIVLNKLLDEKPIKLVNKSGEVEKVSLEHQGFGFYKERLLSYRRIHTCREALMRDIYTFSYRNIVSSHGNIFIKCYDAPLSSSIRNSTVENFINYFLRMGGSLSVNSKSKRDNSNYDYKDIVWSTSSTERSYMKQTAHSVLLSLLRNPQIIFDNEGTYKRYNSIMDKLLEMLEFHYENGPYALYKDYDLFQYKDYGDYLEDRFSEISAPFVYPHTLLWLLAYKNVSYRNLHNNTGVIIGPDNYIHNINNKTLSNFLKFAPSETKDEFRKYILKPDFMKHLCANYSLHDFYATVEDALTGKG